MNKLMLSWLSITMLTITQAIGQGTTDQSLEISFNKTTSIVFPCGITSVDRGSRNILAQKVNGVENVLQLKAGQKNFQETNLTVITADGKLHHFTVNYTDETTKQTITIADTDINANNEALILVKDAVNARDIKLLSEKVLVEPNSKIEKERGYGMTLTLQSIHVSGDIMFYKVQIRNKTAINYDIKSLKFYIRDRKKVKRTSSQEIEAVPVFILSGREKVDGFGSCEMVFALGKFTIPDGKSLHIDLFEQNGGRNLKLKLSNSDILKARPIKVDQHLLTTNK
jgi:conjugative transposon TraN protein